MTLTLEQKKFYYKNRKKIDKIILENARRKGHIVYGARATNKLMPKFLRRETQDYDVYSQTPKQTAERVEKKLDKKLKGNFFFREKAQHEGTIKLKTKTGSRTVADYSRPSGKIPFRTRNKVRYAKLSHAKKNIQKSLRDKASAFRHAKDKELRDRIRIFEMRKRKATIKKSKIKRRQSMNNNYNFKMPKMFIPRI